MVNEDDIYEAVRAYYGGIARRARQDLSCCGPMPDQAAECGCSQPVYDVTLLQDLPAGVADLSLGCGDPITLTSLHPGETVLDLGSGAGLDCFMAARQVGAGGRVIGVDMTPEMIDKAHANAEKLHMDTSNVEFRLGRIEALPVDDESVDVVISNCVINLSPDKAAVFREAFRVLKPGGRIAVSDIVTQGAFPPELRVNLDQWAMCVAGAIDVDAYVDLMREAGFVDIEVVDKPTTGSLPGLAVKVPRIYSARIAARKPGKPAGEAGERGETDVADSLAYFEAVAERWDDMQQSFFGDEVREVALRRAGVRAGQLAADIGAGSGFITAGLIKEGLHVIAVDQSQSMLAQMRHKFADEAGIDYRHGTAEALPIDDGVLDYAFANMYLHHVARPEAAIREMARTLKPGGRLVITDLDKHRFEFLRAEHHDRWMGFEREDVRRWFEEAGLGDVEISSVGSSCCAESSCGCGNAEVSIFIATGVKSI